MSHPFGPKSLAILHHLAKHESKSCFEMELELGLSQLRTHISKLVQNRHIVSLPKKRCEPVQYQIANSGRNVIGAHLQKQESLRYRPMSELPPYVPKSMPVRAGSMNAYALPSRGLT